MLTHPEQTADEVFLGNWKRAHGVPSHLAVLKSVRVGETAYSVDGKKLTVADGMAPLFIGRHEAEAYERLQMARLSAIRTGRG